MMDSHIMDETGYEDSKIGVTTNIKTHMQVPW
jgi:hypothetical protein